MNMLLRMYPGDAGAFFVANVLVQVTVIIGAAWLIARLGSRWNAAWRYHIYLVALLCVLASPLLSWVMQASGVTLVALRSSVPAAPAIESPPPFPVTPARDSTFIDMSPAAPQVAASRTLREVETTRPYQQHESAPSVSFSDILRALGGAALVVWFLGVVLLLARRCYGLRLIAAWRRATKPLAPDAIVELLHPVRQTLEVDRLPPMATMAGLDRPILVGLLRPLVILPEDMLRTLREPELIDILVHECAHAVCRHPIVGLLQQLAGMLFWPHPLVHLLNRQLARAREEVCDNYVLRRNNAPRYARTLLELSQSLAGVSLHPTAIGLFHAYWRLEDRIADLLDQRRKVMTRVHRWSTGLLTVSFLAVALPIAAVRAVQTDLEEPAKPTPSADEPNHNPPGKMTDFRSKTLREWAVLTRSDDEAVAEDASQALHDALPEAMPALIELLKDEDVRVAYAAADALEEMGAAAKPAVPALMELLRKQKVARSPMSPPGCFALRSIIGCKTTIPAALLDLLKDEDASVRRGAAFAVARLLHTFPGEERTKDDPRGYYEVVDAAAAIPILKELLKDKDSGVRGAAAMALVRKSPKSKPVSVPELVPVLVELLKDKDHNVRWMAADDLREIGPDAKAALPALTAMIHDPASGVRQQLAEALENISPEAAKAAVPALMDLLKDQEAVVQERTAVVLLRLSPESKPAVVSVLLDMLKGDVGQRARAARIFGEIGPDVLDASARKEVVPAVKTLLQEIHQQGNWCYRLDTAVALVKLDPALKPVAVSALIELLKHSYWAARQSAAEALGEIGPDAKAAVPALTELLKDKQERVRKAAGEALKKIQTGKG